MRSATAFILILILCPVVSATTVYKCESENGRVTYAESSCGADAYRIDIEESPAVDTARPSSVEVLQRILADKRPRQLQRKVKKIDRVKARYEADIREYKKTMEFELGLLRDRKRRARNNLAGATLENSISREMQVVVKKYQGLIVDARSKIAALNDERRFILESG